MQVSERCGHVCKAPCHTSVLIQVAAPVQQRIGPWEPKQAPKMEIRKLPCPPCPVSFFCFCFLFCNQIKSSLLFNDINIDRFKVPVPVTCIGGHETADWPCHMSEPSSCGRPCGQELYCGNHTCAKPCHTVTANPVSGKKTGSLCAA